MLVPAAGSGLRLGLGPKALLELSGKPLLYWLGQKLQRLADQVVIAVPPGTVQSIGELVPGCQCIEGGDTRQDSVMRLLPYAKREYVILADVARPFISLEHYRAVLAAARDTGAAAAFLQPDVPVAEIRENRVTRFYPAQQMGLFQLPHAFRREILQQVLERTAAENWQQQSTLELVIRAGVDVAVVPGEKTNIKLTTIEDWRFAQHMTEYLS